MRAVRVDSRHFRRKHHVGPGGRASLYVGGKRPRVTIEILMRPELRGVDEDRDDDEARLSSASLDQPNMAVVQGTHRGNQPDALTTITGRGDMTAKNVDGLDQLSQSSLPQSAHGDVDNSDYSDIHRQ